VNTTEEENRLLSVIVILQIGQRHGGFLGILQRALARASPHIWFERSEVKDREVVARRLREHVSDPTNPPILIFPEGTCINNTSVMQFKKGSFEVGSVIYPVAIKVSVVGFEVLTALLMTIQVSWDVMLY
jgi:1-acyl-sn-glycerol-3-phosphate acyltransferase